MKTRRSKPSSKLRAKTDTKPNYKTNTKSGSKSDSKPGYKTDSKPAKKTYSKPGYNSNTKPDFKPDARPIVKPGFKPNTGTNTMPRKKEEICLTVVENNELLKFLLAELPQKSRSDIKSLLAHRQISVDGEVTTKFDYALVVGQKVFINRTKFHDRSQPRGIKVLFEDDYIIVIEKPPGMLSIATAREKDLTAYSILSDHVKKINPKKRIFVVHRLDRDTSGVMLFAKSEEIKESLQNAWKEVVLERSYAVVVEGRVTDDQGTIISWLKENKAMKMYSSNIPNDGQKAVTHYKVLKRSNSYTLLEVKLETGRKNQIRVHMQDLGHSVIGDLKYGGTKGPINRLGLHAQILAFKHPLTNENVYFESPIPKQFLSLFN